MTDVPFHKAEEDQSEDAPSSGRDKVVVALVMVAIGTVAVGALILRHTTRSSSPQMFLPPPGSKEFCCSEQVQGFVSYINTSVDPCGNFFEYTCSNMYKYNLSANTSPNDALVQFVSTGISPTPERRRGSAGNFVHAYFQSCVRSIDDHGSFISQMAVNLARFAHDSLLRPGSRNSLEFIVTVALKYKLPSVVLVNYNHRTSKLFLRFNARCKVAPFYEAMNSSVSAVRGAGNVPLTVEETVEFMTELCRRFPYPVTARTRTYKFVARNAAIDSEVWNVRDIAAALSAVGVTMDNASVIDVTGQAQIKVIRDDFASKADCGVKAAYLLWHSVAAASDRFFSNGIRLDLKGFERCMHRSTSIGDLWQRLKEEMFSSLERDAEVTATFAAVKKAILHDVESSMLLDVGDVTGFTRMLADIYVTTAVADATMRRRVEVPTPSSDFSENILLGEEYSFAVSQGRTTTSNHESIFDKSFSTDVVTAGSGGQLEISLELYLSTQTTSANSNIANMPVLGYELARSIWSGILRNKNWNAKTKENLRNFKNCFSRNAAPTLFWSEEEDDAIAVSLALGSILMAFSRPEDWYTPKSAANMWSMSHAQFFLLSVGLRRCRTFSAHLPPWVREWRMGRQFTYVDDFFKAFNCSESSLKRITPAECKIGSPITTAIISPVITPLNAAKA